MSGFDTLPAGGALQASNRVADASREKAEAKARQLAMAKQQQKIANEKAIDKAAKEFEAVFIAEMLKPMTENLMPEAPFNGGFAEEMFRSFLNEEYARLMVETGGLGVAQHVKRELIQAQSASVGQGLQVRR